MKYLKIFEAYSAEEYQKVLRTIRDMVGKRSDDDIKVYINKHINSELEVFKNIQRYFNKLDRLYSGYNMIENFYVSDGYAADYIRTNIPKSIKRFRNTYDGEKRYSNYYREFAFYKTPKDKKDREQTDYMRNNVEYYHKFCIEKINEILGTLGDDYINLKMLFRKFFKVIYWIEENATKIKEINDNRYNTFNSTGIPKVDVDNERSLHVFNEIQKLYNNVNFENSVTEYNNLKKSINLVLKNIMLKVT